MAIYRYTALKGNNKVSVSGSVKADNQYEARKLIREMGLLPTSISEDNGTQDNKGKIKAGRIKSLKLREKIDFTSTLEILTSTGIPIIEALLFIQQNADSITIRDMCREFRRQIIGGTTLGETLERYRDVFGRVYIGLVKAGEDSGELDKTLVRMLELLKKQESVKSKVIGALIYPGIVIALAIIAVIIMLVFVFPAFDEMFNNLGKPLPAITRACMDMGIFMKTYWLPCVIAVAVAIICCIKGYKNPKVRNVVDSIVLKLPLFSDMMKFSNFSNFMAVLQVSYEAGIPIVDCLCLANLTMDNYILKTAIMKAAQSVQQGTHLSVALKNVNEVPTMMTFMIATGEQSGRLGESLFHCVSFIDKRLEDIVDRFTKFIEPALMVFIGVVVGFLALALYLPLFQAYQQ